MPDTDPALAIVLAIIRVVPVTKWSFARIKPTGVLTSLLSSQPSETEGSALTLELARQRAKVKAGPRIAATLDHQPAYESGITMLFADARTDYGILTLWRTAEDGLFTSSEVGLLTFALDSATDRLSALRMQLEPRPEARAAGVPRRDRVISDAEAALYILDSNLQIVLAWTPDERERVVASGLRTREAERLPTVLEESVRRLTADWVGNPLPKRGVARPVPFLIVRTQPMSGATGTYVGVRIERVVSQNSLSDAVVRFHLSPREVQVLALLFDGRHLDDISKMLHITSSTVQDHIKSMVGKTGSRNRSELIAHVLGWEFEHSTSA
jgi:DNA-binding CsgD family transcriptional regulator